MERNADDMFGAAGNPGSVTGGTSPAGAGGSGLAGSNAPPGGLEYSADLSGSTTTSDRPGNIDQAKTTAQNKIKDKARELQATLADKLDAQAQKLRQKSPNATLAGAADAGTVAVAADDRMANVQDSVARGMSKSADWLRNGDLKADIERQVRDNPGRTLLIALGVGYLLGKTLRNNR